MTDKTTPPEIDETEPWGMGYAAFGYGDPRIPPDDLSLGDKIEWTAGYDHAWRLVK